MKTSTISLGGYSIPVHTLNTVVVGTGAAGYNAADRLYTFGQRDIAIVTEGINRGTSRNTGSDKQTYYKLTLSGGDPDSVGEMARTLFSGECVDGDNALCEASLSAQGFLRLVELGVPFPRNRYGEYIGYKTDHDPRRRATSVGPYTSRMMTECLQKSVEEKGIAIYDRMQVVKVLTEDNAVQGLLCLDMDKAGTGDAFVLFRCKNIVFATGGPAGIYADSVFPVGHFGASGVAFEAGVKGSNLTEWQYGLASVQPRWNVSGTYMQVLPRFVSTDGNGGDEREFLLDFFADRGEMLTKVFLKGYQWPFDVRKARDGSSIVDLLVYLESAKGRRVFLDFRANPAGEPVDFSLLSEEAREYLEKAGACFGTPLERLLHMNAPAVDFYKDKGVDLATEPLEIALCAQHNNGGLSVDCWWQTNVSGFFAAGEAAGSHGVYRPGGSALNAGQVGSLRAAQYIAANCKGEPAGDFSGAVLQHVQQALSLCDLPESGEDVQEAWNRAAVRMSRFGGPVRDSEGIRNVLAEVRRELSSFKASIKKPAPTGLWKVYRLWDVLHCQLAYLEAMVDYAAQGGKSRGSALYSDPAGQKPAPSLPGNLAFVLDDGSRKDLVQEVSLDGDKCSASWRKIRPIPEEDDFFENVWRDFRENGNIY